MLSESATDPLSGQPHASSAGDQSRAGDRAAKFGALGFQILQPLEQGALLATVLLPPAGLVGFRHANPRSRKSAGLGFDRVERIDETGDAACTRDQMDRYGPMLDTDKTARYLQIVSVLQARITSRLYPVGALLPTEADLCAEFGVSRYTVREALRRLMSMGLISRRQGSGTVVVRAEVAGGYSFALRSLSELFQYALDTHFRILGIDEVTIGTSEAAKLGSKPGSRWTIITGVRSDNPEAPPFCYVRSYIPHRLAWVVPELPGIVGPFFGYIEKRANEPILGAEQDISAEAMSPAIAELLGRPPGEISLLLLRRYMSEKGTVVASFNWHIAAEFTYRMALQRDELPRPSA